MASLASELRSKLEGVIIKAREAAEAGAKTALEAFAVHHHEPYPHMDTEARRLRKPLRARAQQPRLCRQYRGHPNGRLPTFWEMLLGVAQSSH